MLLLEGTEGQNEDNTHSAAHPPSGRRTKKNKHDKDTKDKEKVKDAVRFIYLYCLYIILLCYDLILFIFISSIFFEQYSIYSGMSTSYRGCGSNE